MCSKNQNENLITTNLVAKQMSTSQHGNCPLPLATQEFKQEFKQPSVISLL